MMHVHIMCENYGPVLQTASYIRSLLPLTHPTNADRVAVTYGVDYQQADIVIVERAWVPDLKKARRVVARARMDDAALIYSTDDNLLDSNADYVTVQHRDVVKCFAREATGILVSTGPLRTQLLKYNDNIIVVPNAIDERLFAERPAEIRDSNEIVIGYMGTATHDADLQLVLEPLRNVLEAGEGKVVFELIGGLARPDVLDPLRRLPVRILKSGDSVDYSSFMSWLARTTRWDIGIAPLVDTPFNRCKSDLKYVDYGALGIAGIYSNIIPYRHSVRHNVTGLVADNSKQAWRQSLDLLVRDDKLRHSIAGNAQKDVLRNRTLRHSAHQWVKALQKLANWQGRPTAQRYARAEHTSFSRLNGTSAKTRQSTRTPENVTVIVPGSVNYFYDRAGHRIADALRTLGFNVDVKPWQKIENSPSGTVFLVNPAEIIASSASCGLGLEPLKKIIARSRHNIAVSLECVSTGWFSEIVSLCNELSIESIIDVGLLNQFDNVPIEARESYRFVINGLTHNERKVIRQFNMSRGERPIPWALIGHHSVERALLLHRLVSGVAPNGLAYLPALSPVTAGGPHITEEQYARILRHSQLQVWCSHHDHFYLESERFRMSLLAGCVPLKIVDKPPIPGRIGPFQYLIVTHDKMVDHIRSMDFTAVYDRFRQEYLELPTLEDGLGKLCEEINLLVPRSGPKIPRELVPV